MDPATWLRQDVSVSDDLSQKIKLSSWMSETLTSRAVLSAS